MKTKRKPSLEHFKTAQDFGAAFGLSGLEMQMIRQKKKLIERLKETRLKKGLSQAKVATLIGSTQPAIARMESGQVSEISMDFLIKISLALEISVTFKPAQKAA